MGCEQRVGWLVVVQWSPKMVWWGSGLGWLRLVLGWLRFGHGRGLPCVVEGCCFVQQGFGWALGSGPWFIWVSLGPVSHGSSWESFVKF